MQPLFANSSRRLVEALQASPLYLSYQEAFRKATGLPLFLRLPENDLIPRIQERSEQNPFCEALNGGGHPCEACREMHHSLRLRAVDGGCSGQCFARMQETAVPLKTGGKVIAWLWTGQVFLPGAKAKGFGAVEKIARQAGLSREETLCLRRLWRDTPEVSEERYQSVVTLLKAFASQLSEQANHLVLQSTDQEPDAVRKAKCYVRDHLGERLTLEEVARSAGLSPHHFCRVFRRATGLNLTEYINRARVDAARRMLLKADARISEVALEAGYQSLSQFNRSFRAITGENPGSYRRRMLK